MLPGPRSGTLGDSQDTATSSSVGAAVGLQKNHNKEALLAPFVFSLKPVSLMIPKGVSVNKG